jgi:asparagine synthetase B (glutamine-hydrolysing)
LEALRRVFVDTLLPDSTLPPECRTSAAEGIEARLPYLDETFAEVALDFPPSVCVRDGAGKWPLREAARGLVPEDVRTAPKTARLAPSGGIGERARARWLDLYATWLRPERLDPLECVVSARARALLERFAGRPPSDPARAVEDAILSRLVSLAILATPA